MRRRIAARLREDKSLWEKTRNASQVVALLVEESYYDGVIEDLQDDDMVVDFRAAKTSWERMDSEDGDFLVVDESYYQGMINRLDSDDDQSRRGADDENGDEVRCVEEG